MRIAGILILTMIGLVIFALFLKMYETDLPKSYLKEKWQGNPIEVIEIDSCEYIMISSDYKSLTHKGNCKNH